MYEKIQLIKMKQQHEGNIDASSYVTEIVTNDYRTAAVFMKYKIDYCCWDSRERPLHAVCESKGIDTDKILVELEKATTSIHVSNSLQFADWDIDFTINYIIHIHHQYLKKAFPSVQEELINFASGHSDKFPELNELKKVFMQLEKNMIPHMIEEEEIIFPYIKQISHAYEGKEAYATLLVRTLRKPVESIFLNKHETLSKIIHRMRELTHNYIPPVHACVKHRVTFSLLKELDNDLVQHLHLENNILFPRALAMEKDLLQKS